MGTIRKKSPGRPKKVQNEKQAEVFKKAEITDRDRMCAVLLRNGKGISEAFKIAYGELNETDFRKYQQRVYRGWYGKVEIVEEPLYTKLSQTEMTLTQVGYDGMGQTRELTEEEVAKFLWTKERSVRVLTDVVDSTDKNMEKIAAIKELNSMHGYYAPAKVDVTFGLADVMNEVLKRKEDYLEAEFSRAE